MTTWTVAECRDPARFGALAAEWDALYRDCRTATPFQTHAWLHSWWLSYGRRGRLRLVVARRDGRLVGVAPLMLAWRPLPVLVPLGGAVSDFCDVLLHDDCADAAAAALARGLRRAAAGAALIDLREVRPGGAAERLYAHWDGPRRRLADSVCLELPGRPLTELLQRLPGPSARRTRRQLRRLDALGIEHRSVPAEEIPESVATLLELHGRQWQGRGITPEHLSPRFAEHLTRATRRLVASGGAQLTEYRIDGRVLAADVTLMSPRMSGGYLYGAHPDLRAMKADITAMLLRHDTDHAVAAGRPVLSMLRGTEPYKRHWRPDTVVNQRLLLARRGRGWELRRYAAQSALRSRAAGVLRDRLPAAGRRLRGLWRWTPFGAGRRRAAPARRLPPERASRPAAPRPSSGPGRPAPPRGSAGSATPRAGSSP
ncbi:GNAT family N-acetyltransferase [Streptomyces sp. SAJ15]|uniref:GNAT family N-acetyltransferase n=1 Tax=Streptomyces sp. SAJ15 TaxID=2011095 RepID=UPI00135EC80B|nr:glycosyl transferase family 1 [Streptomyces sp. SAJ15]